MAEEYAKPSRTVLSHPAAGDDAVQRDWLAVALLQVQHPRTIPAGTGTRKVANFQALHPDRHSVGVVRIVVFSNQDGTHIKADSLVAAARAY